MRQVLFSIDFHAQVTLPGGAVVPLFGVGLLVAVWVLAAGSWVVWSVRRSGWTDANVERAMLCGAAAAALIGVRYLPIQGPVPVYGFGAMLLAGFACGGWLAVRRAKQIGLDPEIIWDAAMWVFIPGILGARAFCLIQYREELLGGKEGWELLKAIVNLPQGGLVLYGGVLAGALGYMFFCWRRRVPALLLADVMIPSIFIGLMFGRLGCFLNGCCFGDPSDLPWSVVFPKGSVPFTVEVERGLIPDNAACSLRLHPTQVYSALDAALLAFCTWAYFPYRRRHGEALVLGWLLYPISRYLIEILRADEAGQFGTALTISQWISLLLFVSGLGFLGWLQTRPQIGPSEPADPASEASPNS